MKRIAGIVTVALAGCAANPSSDENGPVARCSVTECFNQSAIRSFEILDEQTAVVYVGPQGCPFVVDVDGFNCGLSITPELRFFERLYGSTRASEATGQICGSPGSLYVYSGVADPGLAGVDPLGGPEYDTLGRRRDSFGDALGAPHHPAPGVGNVTVDTINNSDVCRVNEIHSITDDQLLELRVKLGAPPPPPPPIGQGKIEVPPVSGAEGQPSSPAPPQEDGQNPAGESQSAAPAQAEPGAGEAQQPGAAQAQ